MKRVISIAIILTLVLVVALCGLVACNNDANKIRVVEVTHSVFYAPLYIALDSGFFEEEGLKVVLTNGGGADKCMTALLSGQSDIGLMGPEASIYVKNGGKENYPKVFAQMTRKDGSFIIGREKVDNFDISMMHGKEILGGRRGGVPAMALEYALMTKGLINGSNITINYDVQFDMIIPAFESGSGDYCTMFEPAATNFVNSGKGYNLASVGEFAGNMPFTAFMAMQDYMTNNTTQINKFLKAIVKGMNFLEKNSPEECAKALAPSFNTTSLDLLASSIKAYKEIGAYSYSPIMNISEFIHLQDVIINAGVMDTRIDYNDIVDNSYAEAVLKELGIKE